MFGTYPESQRWRVILCGVLLLGLLVPLLMPTAPRKGLNAALLFIGLPIVGYFLLIGGYGLILAMRRARQSATE